MNRLLIEGIEWETPLKLSEEVGSPPGVVDRFSRLREALGSIGTEVGYAEEPTRSGRGRAQIQSVIVFPRIGGDVTEQYGRLVEDGALVRLDKLAAAIALRCRPTDFNPTVGVYDALGGRSQITPEMYEAIMGQPPEPTNGLIILPGVLPPAPL